MPDFLIHMDRFSSLALLEPQSADAHEWIDANLDPDHATLDDSVAVDLRYLEAIVDGIREDGLTV